VSDLFAARSQMAMSLAFHILFAVAGMAMPWLMVLAEARAHRSGDPVDLELARRWAKGTAILFAVGAVSGTVLSFELGLLWPRFMELAGPLVGLPFSLEGFAFFVEAIFLGLYLYGWNRLRPAVHLACGVMVALSGLASGVFVVAVNAWMNTPVGLELDASGAILSVDPWAPFRSPAFFTQALHMSLAAYASVAIAVLGIHAWRLRLDPTSAFHRAAVRVALGFAVVSVPLQLASGDLSAKHVARHQPAKLAAMEAHFHTERGAPLIVGGWPDEATGEVHLALKIPYGLSLLAFMDPQAEVKGLDAVPADERPPVLVPHLAFQIMVGCGLAMLLVVVSGAALAWRHRRVPDDPRWLRLATWCGPLGLLAVEAGWTVTEVGRQPWVIRGVMRTAEAVTPMPGLSVPLAAFTLLYVFLGVVVVLMLRAHVFGVGRDESGHDAEPTPAEAQS
jgi:cytochrome d ubiquinol oxidase subunit I